MWKVFNSCAFRASGSLPSCSMGLALHAAVTVFLGHVCARRLRSRPAASPDAGSGEVPISARRCGGPWGQRWEQACRRSLPNPSPVSAEPRCFVSPFGWRTEGTRSHSECSSSVFPCECCVSCWSFRGINSKQWRCCHCAVAALSQYVGCTPPISFSVFVEIVVTHLANLYVVRWHFLSGRYKPIIFVWQEADVIHCLCVWIITSVDSVTRSEATKHVQSSVENHKWDLHDLSLIWKVFLRKQKCQTLIRGFQLFLKVRSCHRVSVSAWVHLTSLGGKDACRGPSVLFFVVWMACMW